MARARSMASGIFSPPIRGLHSLTSELNLRTFGNALLTLELKLSTFGTFETRPGVSFD